MQTILVCDDDKQIVEAIDIYLTGEGFQVIKAYDGYEALELLEVNQVDLMIVDVMMPGLDGIRTTLKVRENSSIPIIILSAKSEDNDKILGLNIGADDYITKPYSISEMLARVNAVLRRSAIARKQVAAPASEAIYEPQVTYRTLRIDPNEKICYLDDEKVALTKTEFEILSFFLTHPNRIYSREEIIRHVWSGDVVVTNRTIDTNITRLRKKIGRYGNSIETRLGFGYGFKEED